MPTVLQMRGFRFRIYPDDHGQAHFHVSKEGKVAKILMDGLVVIQRGTNMDERHVVIAREIAAEHIDLLTAAWRRFHG